jgi:hypothetical protein
MSCPICEKRPPKRYCPANGEKICAICCGREREVTIDCPIDCSYLIAAHRYEIEHREPSSAEEYPYKDVEFSVEFVYERWALVGEIAAAILTVHARHKDLRDSDVYTAIQRLAEKYRTLGTGIYYERPPELPVALGLYGEVQRFLDEFRRTEAEHVGYSSVSDSDVFKLLVFMLRMAKAEGNGRARSRAFIAFLRARFPLGSVGSAGSAPEPETPRIIIP